MSMLRLHSFFVLSLLPLVHAAQGPGPTASPAQEPAAQERPAAPSNEERVQVALRKWNDTFASGSATERVAVIREVSEIADERITEKLSKALRDDERLVVEAAIEGLRFCAHASSVKALHSALKSNKNLLADPELVVKLIRAIGHHADPSSVKVLTTDVFATKGAGAKARILSLGRIRSKDSVEGLMSMMRLVGPVQGREYMEEFRIALIVLTGVDHGESQPDWTSWWNDNKKDFVVPAEAGALPKPLQTRWAYFWGQEDKRERPPERGERGKREGEPRAKQP